RQGPRLLRSFWRWPRRGGLRPLGRRLVRWIRQRDREGGPASRLGDDLNRAVMALDDLLDEDESEAESFRPRFRRDEGLEQAGPHLGVDPRPCVEDGDRDVIVLRSQADRHPPGRGPLEPLSWAVPEGLLHPARVHGDDERVLREFLATS